MDLELDEATVKYPIFLFLSDAPPTKHAKILQVRDESFHIPIYFFISSKIRIACLLYSDIFMYVTNLKEFVETDLLISLCNFYLCAFNAL